MHASVHSRVRRDRRRHACPLAVAVASLAAIGAVATDSAGATAPARAAAMPGCQSSQLVTWLNTTGNGTAGTDFFTLNFTNLGNSCTLRGYPGVSAVSLSGARLGAPATRDALNKVKSITLKRNRTAHATLGFVDTGALPASSCRAVTAAGLSVFPPNGTTATVVPFPFSTCSKTGPSSLRIAPVK